MEKFMKNTFQVRVVRTGTITLRKKLREQNNLEEGDTLTLIDLGNGVVVMDSQTRVEP
jgi:bifunctional DNA-binding transcriptional regulator/antitoxin component of YhaV-PrlF toxin-antitoxin module